MYFTKKYFLLLSSLLIFYVSEINASYPEIAPKYETPEIATIGDAADDPAIWFNSLKPHQSLVLGTDKRSGVYIYNLKGRKLGFTKAGNINNIDLRTINNSNNSSTFIVGSNRSLQTIDLWIYQDKDIRKSLLRNKFSLSLSPNIRVKSNINIYGICAGNDPEFGLIVFATEDGGPNVEIWQYKNNALKLLKTFNNKGESEGCIFDDENRTLFISEENIRGVLRAYKVENNLNFSSPTIIDNRKGNIGYDPEGIAIYKETSKSGFIVLSNQGDSLFNLYNRQAPYEYITSFKVGPSLYGVIDGVSDTDGVAILNKKLNRDFPKGIMVVQDGYNKDKKIDKNQNFKFVSFADVLMQLDL